MDFSKSSIMSWANQAAETSKTGWANFAAAASKVDWAGLAAEVPKMDMTKLALEAPQVDWARFAAEASKTDWGSLAAEASKVDWDGFAAEASKMDWESFKAELLDWVRFVAEACKEAGNFAVEAIKKRLEEHPRTTVLQAGLFLLALAPSLTTTPLLTAAGFTFVGPLAGSMAAAWQSAHGVGLAFSGLQSAAMGGYGAAAVNGIVSANYLAGIVMAEILKGPPANEGTVGEVDEDEGDDKDKEQ